MEKRILAICGSPRRRGNSDKLLDAAASGASPAIPVETVFLRDYQFMPCLGCEACRKDLTCTRHHDGMSLLYPKLENSLGLILACPTHHYNVTAWMKAFIDRLYPYYVFSKKRPGPWSSRLAGQGRKAALLAVCEEQDRQGLEMTLAAMRLPLSALGYEITGELGVAGVFKVGGVATEAEAMAGARALGESLATAL